MKEIRYKCDQCGKERTDDGTIWYRIKPDGIQVSRFSKDPEYTYSLSIPADFCSLSCLALHIEKKTKEYMVFPKQ